MDTKRYTAFRGCHRIATGSLRDVFVALEAESGGAGGESLLIFDDETGRQLDFDLRGSLEERLARIEGEKPRAGPGRPALGVSSREISLLPRHWEWLEARSPNVSGTLRRLLDEAIKREPAEGQRRRVLEAVDRELWVLAGNLPGCEEASRSLYRRDFPAFRERLAAWPPDIGAHLGELARGAEGGAERPAD